MPDVRLGDGGRIAAETRGRGPALLLLRPLGGSLESWGPFADGLARRLRIVMFDPRGSGCSSPPPLLTTTRTMAADAIAVLDALSIPRAHVYGISLGGMVASWLAIDAPTRVDRLVLASTPVRGRTLHVGGWRRALELAGCLARPARSAEACLATAVLSARFRAANPGEVARIQSRASIRPASHRGILALLGAALVHDIDAQLTALGAETLVVAGAEDALLPPASQRALAERLHAHFVAVPLAGHDVSTEAAETVAELVVEHALHS